MQPTNECIGDFQLVREFFAPNQIRTSLARRNGDSELFILKEFPSNDLTTREEAEKLMKRPSHDNVIKVLAILDDEPSYRFYVQLEFCDGSSLHRAINKQRVNVEHFDEQQLSVWFGQMADACRFLHNSGIVHGNLNAKTVFLSMSRQLIKIGVLQHSGIRTAQPSDDSFMLGALLYHLATLKLPNGISYDKILRAKQNWSQRDPIPASYSHQLVKAIDWLLNEHPAIADFQNDAWLAQSLADRSHAVEKALEEEQEIRNRCSNLHKPPPAFGYCCQSGPHNWAKSFPSGNGKRQSPIAIDTLAPFVQFDSSLGPLQFDYSQVKATTIFNAGHTFQVNFDPDSPATLRGGPLGSDVYQLIQYHPHWSASDDAAGCEHVLNGVSYPAELHFVHFNTKYKTFFNALNYPDGLAVIGFFIKSGERGEFANRFQPIIDQLRLIRYKAHDIKLPKEASQVRQLMPENLDRYFTYEGSLTGPPLSEAVQWLVVPDPLTLAPSQLAAFRELRRLNTFEQVDCNYRPVCPLNGRTVRCSFPPSQLENLSSRNANACSE